LSLRHQGDCPTGGAPPPSSDAIPALFLRAPSIPRTRPIYVAKTNLYKKTLNWFFLYFGARQICA
jgi:hypothetical protein